MALNSLEAAEAQLVEQMRGLTSRSLTLPAGHGLAAPTFCNAWPVAKAVLAEIAKVAGGLVAVFIGVIIAAGDKICGAKP